MFQPETIAEALVAAIDDPRREYWLGYSSVRAILGAQLMPEFLDRYLAENVVFGQQTDEPVSPGRIDNLEAPAPAETHSAHGRFDDEARPHATMFDPTNVRRVVILRGSGRSRDGDGSTQANRGGPVDAPDRTQGSAVARELST